MSPSGKWIPEARNSGAIIINMEALESKGLAEPTSPNPKTSGTGYMFLKSLVNAWGEDEAFSYFDKFANQVLEFTSSGSGPVNALVQGEVVVGLGMTAQAVTQISAGAPLKVIYFEEGSPYTGYGAAIIEGKQGRHEVKEVFDFFYNYLIYEDKELFFPEQIYKDITLAIENYPVDIPYADMAGNTTEERIRLLEMWEY